MSVLKRAKRIFSQSWDDMSKHFKNPEADMKNAFREMEQSLSDLRQTAAMRITDGKIIEKQIKELQEGQQKWGSKAASAVGAGQDDLALKALKQKKKYSVDVSKKLTDLNYLNREVKELKSEIQKAELKFKEFQNKARMLQHNKIFAKTGLKRIQSNVENVESLDKKFKELEAEVDLREMATKPSINDELSALKKKVQSQKKKKEK